MTTKAMLCSCKLGRYSPASRSPTTRGYLDTAMTTQLCRVNSGSHPPSVAGDSLTGTPGGNSSVTQSETAKVRHKFVFKAASDEPSARTTSYSPCKRNRKPRTPPVEVFLPREHGTLF